MVAGKQMLGWITEAPEWDWANTEKTVAPLREAMQGLEGAMQNLSPFEKAYFMEEQAALRGSNMLRGSWATWQTSLRT